MISAIISCMNRTDRLVQMLPTWAEIEKIKDIVVVDWSSKDPIAHDKDIKLILKKYNKIKIIRVDGQKYFHLPKSYNLGYLFTDKKNKILLKLDVDYVSINSDWINTLAIENLSLKKEGSHQILKKYFICGMWRFYKSSSGFLLVNKEDFHNIKGYNQNLAQAWGFDDQDIQQRLIKLYEPNDPKFSFKQIFFWDFKNYIHHIPHNDELRFKNYPVKELNEKINTAIAQEKIDWEFPKFKILRSGINYFKLILIEKSM